MKDIGHNFQTSVAKKQQVLYLADSFASYLKPKKLQLKTACQLRKYFCPSFQDIN